MKVLKIIGFVLLGLVLLIVILGLVAPSDYHAERSIQIDAPKELVFSHIKYWRNWRAWSPWAEADPQMEMSIEGQDGSVGAMSKWSGDPQKSGSGGMTNTGVKENEEISYHLHFIEPWESESDGYIRLSDQEGSTLVAWGFQGETPFPWNVLMLLMSMESMVSKDFDRGLTLLKTLAENEYAMLKKYKINEVKFKAKNFAVIQKVIPMDQIAEFFGASFASLGQVSQNKGLRLTGAPTGLYYSWDEQAQTTNLAAAMPISGSISTEEIKTIKVHETNALSVDYYGAYEGLGMAHQALNLYIATQGIASIPPAIEEYLTDPGAEPDSSKWLTRIYYLID